MQLYLGKQKLRKQQQTVHGQWVKKYGEQFYQIAHYDKMQPFFISLESDSDLWLYAGSRGALTAGRISPDKALFPYYTDDKIMIEQDLTGPCTILRVDFGQDADLDHDYDHDADLDHDNDHDLDLDADHDFDHDHDYDFDHDFDHEGELENKTYLWEPFSTHYAGVYQIRRNLYKNLYGTRLIYEEINDDLGLAFSYEWSTSAQLGLIRTCRLENLTERPVQVEILDGMRNIMPANIDHLRQNAFSTLVDAYKVAERLPNSSIALYRMEATLVDRAEASEALAANMVWSVGLGVQHILLTDKQLDAFRLGEDIVNEPLAKGQRGAYFVHAVVAILAKGVREWAMVADVEQAPSDVKHIQDMLTVHSPNIILANVMNSVQATGKHLYEIVRHNDGIQTTADYAQTSRHFANTLYNTMRGGYYVMGYEIDKQQFRKHVQVFAPYLDFDEVFGALPEQMTTNDLLHIVAKWNNPTALRLALEYLPLTFGRRHGDPSRPWNLFAIHLTDEMGKPIISYQGNWRDIFQNWEALSISYPAFLPNIIAKFLNASTIDGYNPYRIGSNGIDWEVIEPENPWSNIGYWGDHQIVYLTRLLEMYHQVNPQEFETFTQHCAFAFANVPYRLKSAKEIMQDPKNTITFSMPLHNALISLTNSLGSDAKLVLRKCPANANDGVEMLYTGFYDKILITLCTKLSNFVPEAGIWMNTLRPEWNDANNALVGNGASVVTLCHVRRLLCLLLDILKDADYQVFTPVAEFVNSVATIFANYQSIAQRGFTAEERYTMTWALQKAGEEYREKVYPIADIAMHEGQEYTYATSTLTGLAANLRIIGEVIDESIRRNQRTDNLYHAYNVLHFEGERIEIEYLYEMLEGQVAVLSSGLLSYEQTITLLRQMTHSQLYRADQQSYMLYPDRRRPLFFEKNNLTQEMAEHELTQRLLQQYPHLIVEKDSHDMVHFHIDFNNADALLARCKSLNINKNDQQTLAAWYEELFQHKAFTGRSGTMYKYEGLGCIYWHQVSKLLLAVAENIQRFGLGEENELLHIYEAIEEGIGAHKSPAEYGSFPFDAYSHTPAHMGVQQPGMTGQVKEDILSRFAHLGVQVKDGHLLFTKGTLRKEEFMQGKDLYFSYCGTPIHYILQTPDALEGEPRITVKVVPNRTNDWETVSKAILYREGIVKEVIVTFANTINLDI